MSVETKTWDVEKVLNPATHMDAVSLRVGDLELMSSYYSNALALEPIAEHTAGAEVHRTLGRGTTEMVKLIGTPHLPSGDPHEAGLFHTAFLFPSRQDLAAVLYRAGVDPRSRFVGSADHLVSEAFYFSDPEGNGIELYRDRPRDQWGWPDGEVAMDSLPLDPHAFCAQNLEENVVDHLEERSAVVGHVHLQVGDLVRARDFYVNALGFEVTAASWPGALFVSAGGYHHHLAMNVWNSRGAGPRAASLGLGDVRIAVPGREDLDAVSARLLASGLAFEDDGRSVVVSDPWGTRVTLALGE